MVLILLLIYLILQRYEKKTKCVAFRFFLIYDFFAVMSTGATIPVMSTGAREACVVETSPCY